MELSLTETQNLLKEIDDKLYSEKYKDLDKEGRGDDDFEEDMLELAEEAYNSSTDYLETYKVREWVDAYMLYNGQHTKDTKFFDKNRPHYLSKFFIPKTYEFIITQTAYVKQAMFSGSHLIDCQIYNDYDKEAQIQADFFKTFLEYRLKSEKNWFYKHIIAQYQDSHLTNFPCSKVAYDFKKQQAIVKPISVERIRIHPQADPFDPVNSSPYLIHIIPMYVYQVKKRMKSKGDDKWLELSNDDLVRTVHTLENDVASARNDFESDIENNDGDTSLKDHQIVYVHENFIIGEDGEDYCFYTLGSNKLLSKIYKTKELYFHGRPFVIGSVMLESGRVYPKSPVIHAKPLQEMLNELQNMSNDIKRKVAMPNYLVSRKVHDLYALESAKPGSYIKVNDPTSDIVPLNTQTQANGLQEGIMTAATHIDDMLGRYGISTAQSRANANSSVGGMQQQASSANLISELYLSTFIETYVEPLLEMYLAVELQYNGTNKELVKKIFKDYGVEDRALEKGVQPEDLPTQLSKMNKELKIGINAAVGASNPDMKFQKIIATLSQLSKLAAEMNPAMPYNMEEVIKETMSIQGYKNPSRFIKKSEDPMIAQLQQQVQQLQQQLQTKENNPEYIAAEIENLKAKSQEMLANVKSKEVDVELKLAQKELTTNKAIESGVQATFGAVQAAVALAETQEASPIADHILESSLKLNREEQPTNVQQYVPQEPIMPQQGMETMPTEMPMEQQVNPQQVNPESAFEGFNQGIETTRAD